MNVFIARDGAILGEYPREQIDQMARAGELNGDDHYWQEDMDDWQPLPALLGPGPWEPATAVTTALPAPKPWDKRVILGGLAGLVITAVALSLFFSRTGNQDSGEGSSTASHAKAAETALAIRDKAAADLRKRIERLPVSAKPPLNTFYYDVRVNMRKTFDQRTPWSATIHGWANVIDPATDQTVSRTDFTLTTDYEDNEWVFKHYRAQLTSMATHTSSEVEERGDSATPPSLAAMLGLKRMEVPSPGQIPPAITKVEERGAIAPAPKLLPPPLLSEAPAGR